ncbi:MAG: hypothetical protein LBB53_04690 [Prevotellaceae bacterium]|jgi:hypothetical protein|nr:hypothetical protein [Prevotellaceae bacterium]
MKKFTFLFAALVAVVFSANAQLANPVNTDGEVYDVVWDCNDEEFKHDYLPQFDETFTFAVDVTGSALLEWVAAAPAGITRSIGCKVYGWGETAPSADFKDAAYRLTRIEGNIYGATWNLKQLTSSEALITDATTTGNAIYVKAVLFGYGYGIEDGEFKVGISWWSNAYDIGGPADNAGAPIFRTAPYDGTHASDAAIRYTDGPLASAFGEGADGTGWANQCFRTSAINEVPADANIVGYEYYNLQGMRLSAEPVEGLFIKISVLDNGRKIANTTLKTK